VVDKVLKAYCFAPVYKPTFSNYMVVQDAIRELKVDKTPGVMAYQIGP